MYEVILIIGQYLIKFGGAIAEVFKKTWDFFQVVWSSTIKPFIQWSWKMIKKLHTWLDTTLKPLLKFLDAARKDILNVYDKWFKPIFVTLDLMRQFLKALEIFHVPFAQKADAAISALEARLLAPMRLALQTINEITGWVNRIINLDGLFQRLTLIESQWHYVGDTWNVLLKHKPAGVSFADNAARRARTVPAVDPKVLSDAVADYHTTGGGALGPDIDDGAALWLTSAV